MLSPADVTEDGRASGIGLVLGAGGVAGGAFHAGVLAAMAEVTGWDPRTAEVIVGTSAGSVAAASLRAGLCAPDLFARAVGHPLSDAGARLIAAVGTPPRSPTLRGATALSFGSMRTAADVATTLRRAAARPFAARPGALLAGLLPEGAIGTEFISDAVGRLHPGGWPSEPMWLCAVRVRDGRLVVFGREAAATVAEAVAASCAIPGFFRPVEIGDDRFVDGGAHSPTNADVLSASPVRLVIVSSPMSYAGSGRRLGLAPARRWSRLLLDAEALRLRRRGVHVLAFQPSAEDLTVMGNNAMDPSRRAEIAACARRSTLNRLARADVQDRLHLLAPRR